MKRKHKILIILLAVAVTVSLTTVPAFALTESEVQDQVNAVGKESVTGNLFVWFLCAIAFLKVSQKIDSFMSSLGINVGHTGGSMLAEAMIAMRGIGVAKNYAGKVGGSSRSSGGGSNTFMKGGLSGVVSRKVTNTAINNATGSKNGGLGGMVFNSSLGKGGGFANSVIGKIATGNISSTGSISGESAADSLMSYMGYTALGPEAEGVPSFSDVEIGGGHIFATETNDEHPEGIAMGKHHISLPVQSEPEEDGLSMEQLSSADDTLDKLLEEQDICMLLQNCKRQYTGTARLGIEAIEWKVKGLSGAEIAKMYGVKPNLVGAWISRAAGRLKQSRDFMQYFDRSVEIDSS